MVSPEHWEGALEAATAARIILIIGETDTGKTHFTTRLANALLDCGHPVAVVDADLGQSDIGPPTTVGLGLVNEPLTELGEAQVVGLYFVGSTSPQGHLLPTVIGTKKMVEKAERLGIHKIIVDTSGLIQGEIGRLLKQHKIDLVDPDLILALQRTGECDHILRPYLGGPRPVVLRLASEGGSRRRTQEERRQHRERTLMAYFQGSKTLHLDLSRVLLRQPSLFVGQPLSSKQMEDLSTILDDMVLWAERRASELTLVTPDPIREIQLRQIQKRFDDVSVVNFSLDDFQGGLVGLDNHDRECQGLGVVRGVDFVKQVLLIETPVPETEIAAVRIGRHKLHP